MRFTTFTLFDCSWPMKCQRNASPYSACFASRSWARFSPTTVTPASASDRHVGERDVLRRRDDGHVRPDLAPARRASRSRICLRRQHRSLPARRARARRGGGRRRAPGGRACRGRGARRAPRPRARSARSAADQRSSLPSTRQVGVEEVRHLRPDLVAARPDRRPDRRPRSRPARARATPASTTPSESPRQPACRTASARGAVRARDAIGRQSADIASIGTCGSSVQRPSPGSPRAPGVRAVHGRRVHLPVERQPLVAAGRAPRTRCRRFSSTRSAASPVPRVRLSDVVRRLADAADAAS